MGTNLLSLILFVLLTAILVAVLFRQLRLPVLLGYLLVGALLGPHSLGIVPDTPYISSLANFGIVFLLFTIGLEFSLPNLIALGRIGFLVGSLQVVLTILIISLIASFFGVSVIAAFTIGCIVAMSSTALVFKQLNDQLQLHTTAGVNAIAILLFQDLAVVPILILLASAVETNGHSLIIALLWAFVKGLIAIGLIFVVGRFLLSPIFRVIAKTRAIELFTLLVLFVTLTAAWITNLLGLSYALGAFLAGIMLSETEFRHQIEVEIRPFRDVLLGLFFVSIGLLTNIPQWQHLSSLIALIFVAICLGKALLIFLICRLLGNSSSNSLRTAIILAQAGEFSFAFLTLALENSIFSADLGQAILAALLISLVISPLILNFNKQISEFIAGPIRKGLKPLPKFVSEKKKPLKNHVILCGYGRVGQHIARLLEKIDYPYIAIDLDPDLVHRAQAAGENVLFGDPTRTDILQTASLKNAKALVLCFHDLKAAKNILGIVKQLHPDLPVLVRCRDETELKQLKEKNGAHVIAELFEASLTLSQLLLNIVSIPPAKVSEILHEIRTSDYDLLYKVFTSENEQLITNVSEDQEQLFPISIPVDAFAVDKKIVDLTLNKFNVELIALRRGDIKQFKPHSSVKVNANDILILYGLPKNIRAAEKWLVEG